MHGAAVAAKGEVGAFERAAQAHAGAVEKGDAGTDAAGTQPQPQAQNRRQLAPRARVDPAAQAAPALQAADNLGEAIRGPLLLGLAGVRMHEDTKLTPRRSDRW